MNPDFSVIIVSYNVSAYLKLCLQSVIRAAQRSSVEIWIVDNASTDHSAEMVKKCFPGVHLIVNSENIGFSKANNQALRKAKGRYLLMLNPDTIIPETLFEVCSRILASRPEVGGTGIKMLDGQGYFLPESKRGLPTPLVSFFKITGIYHLFPESPVFNKYYLGNTSPSENQYVEILAGAFLLVRKEVAEKIGYMPEDYFMYGEDIDFSYQILRSGYKNYYIAEEKIIHFKGESTKKGSLNYVYIFYKAMAIFSAKYFGRGNAVFYNLLISIGISITALGAIIKRIVQTIGIPIIEFFAIYGGYWYIHDYWEKNHRFISGGEYPVEYVYGVLPIYSLVLMLSIYAAGGYKKTQRTSDAIRGLGLGFIVLLMIYGLSPEEWRFSRAIMVLGVVNSLIWMIFFRSILKKLKLVQPPVSERNQSVWIISQNGEKFTFRGSDFTSVTVFTGENLVNSIENFRVSLISSAPDYVIFDSDSLSFSFILKYVELLRVKNSKILYKIPHENIFVGSNNVIDLSARKEQFESITIPLKKRIYDVILSVFFVFPFLTELKEKYSINLYEILRIISGKTSLIGYSTVKPSLIDLGKYVSCFSDTNIQNIISDYYSKYSLSNDVQILRTICRQLSAKD